MKILKTILIVIVAILAIPLIAALFVKKDFSIVRDISINKPKQEVFDYIKSLKNQNNYSKWAKMDPEMKQEFIGTDGTVGFVSAWDSQKDDVGKGEQKITLIKEGEALETELHFIKPFDSKATAVFTTTAVSDSTTKVTWEFKGANPYPFNLMCLFFNMDELVGGDLSIGLTNLKNLLEK